MNTQSPSDAHLIEKHEAVHAWFELTYAQYLTIPRSILEAMPDEWQARFVQCLNELDATFDWRPKEGRYWVTLKDGKGRIATDRFREYRRPDHDAIEAARKIPPPATDDNYVAWLRFKRSGEYTQVVVCDSDAPGAFKVYRRRNA
jgi:hypothetical protein